MHIVLHWALSPWEGPGTPLGNVGNNHPEGGFVKCGVQDAGQAILKNAAKTLCQLALYLPKLHCLEP